MAPLRSLVNYFQRDCLGIFGADLRRSCDRYIAVTREFMGDKFSRSVRAGTSDNREVRAIGITADF